MTKAAIAPHADVHELKQVAEETDAFAKQQNQRCGRICKKAAR